MSLNSFTLRATVGAVAVGVVLLVGLVWGAGAGCVAAFAAIALAVYRFSMWIAIFAAAWAMVFLFVLTIDGPYDSPRGPAVVPVLAVFAACVIGGWIVGRLLAGRSASRRSAAEPVTAEPVTAEPVTPEPVTAEPVTAEPVTAGAAPERTPAGAPARPELAWPSDARLRIFLLATLGVAIVAAMLKYRLGVPLFADNPDVVRKLAGDHSNIFIGLLSEAWTLGLSVALLRVLTGGAKGRWLFLAFTLVFLFGSALGASKNTVLVGIVPALVAALSVRSVRRARTTTKRSYKVPVLVGIGLVAVAAAVFLGGQRTLAGTGAFEDEFRARYGNNVLTASVASLDLSLSAPTETFGRLWAEREAHEPAYGRYALTFTGSVGQRLFGPVDLYALTAKLSLPYYMNTATFVAIPLLDFGPIGAAVFLALLGLLVGLFERRFEFAKGPAQHLGRAFVIYFAVFGVYELYPLIHAFWLSLAPGLVLLYLLGRRYPLGWRSLLNWRDLFGSRALAGRRVR